MNNPEVFIAFCRTSGLKLNHVQSNLVTLILTFASNFFLCVLPFSVYILFLVQYRATQNSTHISISTTLNACGTLVNETEDELIFWNEIRVDAVIIDNFITRTHDIHLLPERRCLASSSGHSKFLLDQKVLLKILSYIYLHLTAYTMYSNYIYSL